MVANRTQRGRISRLPAVLGVITAAVLLKLHYSRASSEDLTWIIGPTSMLTELISNLSFSHEPGYGWTDLRHHVVIAPVCAGVNFLIMSFCMVSFQILRRPIAGGHLLVGIIMAALASYLMTVIANALRITLAVTLFTYDIHTAWLSHDMLHRIAGIVIYYLFLCLISTIVTVVFAYRNQHNPVFKAVAGRSGLLLIPLVCYLVFSIALPFANNALKNHPAAFIEHALTIVLVSTAITLILFIIQYLYLHLTGTQGG